jgi:transcriptional regulator with XRE-family HTH domain
MSSSARGINKSVHSVEQAAFCELMIAARKRAGLTQQELAKRLKKPQSFVAKYEGGERRIDVVEFVAISRAIGADPIRLLGTLVRQGEKQPTRR